MLVRFVQGTVSFFWKLTPIVLAAGCEVGILDDLSVVGVADNGFVAVGLTILTVLTGFGFIGTDVSLRRAFVTALISGLSDLMIIDDASGVGVFDNPVAFVTTMSVVVMKINDWRRSRR